MKSESKMLKDIYFLRGGIFCEGVPAPAPTLEK